jgi:hypothetical protein
MPREVCGIHKPPSPSRHLITNFPHVMLLLIINSFLGGFTTSSSLSSAPPPSPPHFSWTPVWPPSKISKPSSQLRPSPSLLLTCLKYISLTRDDLRYFNVSVCPSPTDTHEASWEDHNLCVTFPWCTRACGGVRWYSVSRGLTREWKLSVLTS